MRLEGGFMNSAHIHLFLNHFPIIGTIFAFILLGYALLRKSEEVIKIGLVMLVFVGLVSIPVYLTGEPAEEIVENLAGVSEAIIEQHESYAKYALATAILTSVIALASLVFSFWSEKKASWMVIATFFLAAITGGWMLKTASLGGQIRHTEIRDAAAATQTEQQTEQNGEKDDDDH